MRNILGVGLIITGFIFTFGCGSDANNTANLNNTNPRNANAVKNTAPATPASTPQAPASNATPPGTNMSNSNPKSNANMKSANVSKVDPRALSTP